MSKSITVLKSKEYNNLLSNISTAYTQGRIKANKAVNVCLAETYWQIGQYIVEFEQGGNIKAEYGKALLKNLARDLSLIHGKGFSLSNLIRFRQFYVIFPIYATLSHKLSWSPSSTAKVSRILKKWVSQGLLVKLDRGAKKTVSYRLPIDNKQGFLFAGAKTNKIIMS